jgi:hypothetical protein
MSARALRGSSTDTTRGSETEFVDAGALKVSDLTAPLAPKPDVFESAKLAIGSLTSMAFVPNTNLLDSAKLAIGNLTSAAFVPKPNVFDSAKLAIGNPTSGVFVSKANLRDSAKLAIADQTTTTSTLKSILVGSATLALGKSTSELFPGSADGGRVLRESWGDRKSNPEVAKREPTKNSADQAAPIIVDCSPVCVVCGGSLVSLKTTISWLAPGLGIRRRHVFPACPGCVERGQDQKSSDLLRSLLAENGASRFLPVIVQGGGAGDGNPAGRLRLVRDGE